MTIINVTDLRSDIACAFSTLKGMSPASSRDVYRVASHTESALSCTSGARVFHNYYGFGLEKPCRGRAFARGHATYVS